MTTTEVGLAVSVVCAVATNAAVISRWGSRLSTHVTNTFDLASKNQTRIQAHEDRTQHGPSPYVTQAVFDSVSIGQQKLDSERFDQINKRLDRIDGNILALTASQGQMMTNMMELTRAATDELKKATAARD